MSTPTPLPTGTPFTIQTALPSSEEMTIYYTYDSLYRLTAANYSTGDSSHYTFDAVGNRLTQESTVHGLPSTVNYTYDIANRLILIANEFATLIELAISYVLLSAWR